MVVWEFHIAATESRFNMERNSSKINNTKIYLNSSRQSLSPDSQKVLLYKITSLWGTLKTSAELLGHQIQDTSFKVYPIYVAVNQLYDGQHWGEPACDLHFKWLGLLECYWSHPGPKITPWQTAERARHVGSHPGLIGGQ